MAKKKKPNHGKLTKAGQLLSQFIRVIALEETEFVKDADGNDRMVTKAEAIAQLMWKKALGYKESITHDDGTVEERIYPPDKWAIDRLWDRMEGRAPLMNPDKKDRRTIADRVSEQGVNRINKIAGSSLTS